MDRREFLLTAAGTTLWPMIASGNRSLQSGGPESSRARDYLNSILADRRYLNNFILGEYGSEDVTRGDGWTFEPDLGWVHCTGVHSNSVDGSRGFYAYEPDGARKVINSAHRTSRIHAYGDSFTHCDQVNNGETWEEFLAAHLQEPIRNYGVGGYSVYQAYRRMLKVEQQHPAEYIILNIWDDDHYRNLDAWRSIRFGQGSNVAVTLPHLRVNVKEGQCEERENILITPDTLYNLTDPEFVWETFKDDPVLKLVLAATAESGQSGDLTEPIAVTFGIPSEKLANTPAARRVQQIHTEAALFATKNVVTWTEEFVRKTGRQLLVILSFGRGNIASDLRGEPRFDASFAEWLQKKPYPVIDMREAFREDYRKYSVDVDAYLAQYYIGHHTPLGNFFTAWALKDSVVDWLDPAPLPYR